MASKASNNVLNEPSGSYASGQYFTMASAQIGKSYIKEILSLSGLSLNELMDILPISIDTYKRKAIFNPPVTEKILEIEEVYRNGLQAFGDDFKQWMETNNPSLGNVIPKSLLANSFGIRLLLMHIGRMEHGILA